MATVCSNVAYSDHGYKLKKDRYIMNDIKHTPGPWTIGYCEKSKTWFVSDDDNPPFGEDVCYHVKSKDKAHLIAAAPELLEACELALLSLVFPGSHPAVKACKAAINKAKGV